MTSRFWHNASLDSAQLDGIGQSDRNANCTPAKRDPLLDHKHPSVTGINPPPATQLQQRGAHLQVLHVYRTYFPETQGGLEEVIRQICLTTKELGLDSKVLALSPNPSTTPIERPEATVHQTKLWFEVASCGFSATAFSEFRRLAQWADVVHFHFPWPFADILHLTTRINKPCIVTYHSDIVRQKFLGALYRPLMVRFLRAVDRIVCTSPNYFATSDILSEFQHKVDIIPIGIDKESFPPNSESTLNQMRSRYGENFFLFVGVLRYYKGLHILLDAIKEQPYRVVIAGAGPTEQELRAQAKQLGLTNVSFAGYVSDQEKAALFKLSKAVIFPSYLRSEAFGVALLEGAMYSKPLISTEVGSGTSHVNIDQKTGIVVAPGSAPALREAMSQIHYRPELARSMGRRALERYNKLFTGHLMGLRYKKLYDELLGKPESLLDSNRKEISV